MALKSEIGADTPALSYPGMAAFGYTFKKGFKNLLPPRHSKTKTVQATQEQHPYLARDYHPHSLLYLEITLLRTSSPFHLPTFPTTPTPPHPQGHNVLPRPLLPGISQR